MLKCYRPNAETGALLLCLREVGLEGGGDSFLLDPQATAAGVDAQLGTIKLSCLCWQSPATSLLSLPQEVLVSMNLKMEYGIEDKTPC